MRVRVEEAEEPNPFWMVALVGFSEMEKSPTFIVIAIEWDTFPL